MKLFRSDKLKWIFSGLALSLVSHTPARADLAPMIQQAELSKDNLSVIVPVADSPDDNYGLLSMSVADFVKKLELTDPTKLENAYFKVVDDESSDALPVGNFDGDNVLYHMMIARNYYAKLQQGADFPDDALQHKITVRVRVDHGYNLVLHFAQWEDHNNSRYIPASFAGDQIAQWGREIWFDSSKTQLNGMDWYGAAVSSGLAVATESWINLSSTPLEIYQHYNSGIDASKQPGVIYHETFHYSSDTEAKDPSGLFPMASEGNPVAEDYANYFGASILGRPQIADLMQYSGRYYKRDYGKVREVTDTSPLQNNYNSIPFGPSMMWQIRVLLGQERADQMIWNSLKFINGTFLETDEQKALSAAAHEDTALSPTEVQSIDDLLNKYHQSYVNLELKANPGELRLIDAKAAQQSANQEGAGQIKEDTSKPEFRHKLVAAMDQLAAALGYAGDAVFAAGNAPVNFGTDLASGIAVGHGMISEHDKNTKTELIGAGGGIASVYYFYVGLDALGYSFALDPAVSASYAVVLANTLICSAKDADAHSERAQYCKKSSQIMAEMSNEEALGGAKVGDAVHHEIIRIKDFFDKAFKKRQANSSP